MTKRKLWNKPVHATRRPTRAYTPAEMTYIETERAKEPPTSWERLGRALDRHPMSIQDKWYRLNMERRGDDREVPPISAKGVWPEWARFDINGRNLVMKPIYSPATSNAPLSPGRGPGARRDVTTPSVAAGSLSEAP